MSNIIRTKRVIQETKHICGIIYIYIILDYYNTSIEFTDIISSIKNHLYSGTAKELKDIIEKYHFSFCGYKMSIKNLLLQPPPFILHWEFNHYIVYEGTKNHLIFLNDPLQGHIKMNIKDFSKHFTGFVFMIRPISVGK